MPSKTSPIRSDTPAVWSVGFADSQPIDPIDPAGLGSQSEWLLPDGLGGFAMGTVVGVPMRRYHGLLCASLSPPVCRAMLLNALDECVHIPRGGLGEGLGGDHLDVRLTGFQFSDQDPPTTNPHLIRFTKDTDSCTWTYSISSSIGRVEISKRLWIADGIGGARIDYQIRSEITSHEPITIEIRPLLSMRDFHELNAPGSLHPEQFSQSPIDGPAGACVSREGFEACLNIRGDQLDWEPAPGIWRGVTYAHEQRRHQSDCEDLYCPGAFISTVEPGQTKRLSISATIADNQIDWEQCAAQKHARIQSSIEHALGFAGDPQDPILRDAIAKLAQASDDFIVKRNAIFQGAPSEPSSAPSGLESPSQNPKEHGNAPSGHPDEDGKAGDSISVLAGYPWFSDWGRDTMIALPGLFLATGRFEQAHQTLTTFADAIEHGLIPNRFDDAGGASHYNTVDASLWFIHACGQWARATGKPLDTHLINACDQIIDAYIAGTINTIGLDEDDGLIYAGDATTQLTWMDALRDGVCFTPRHGKAIEINALWINALESRLLMDEKRPELAARASQARASIVARMTKGPAGGLVDRITREPGVRISRWIGSDELRPNQIFAISLAHVDLPESVRIASHRAVTEALLTPVGLRTLDPQNPNYCPHYEGSMNDRDLAYHNGTVWPWLLGSYCEALMQLHNFDEPSRQQAQGLLLGLVDQMGCGSVGQLFEIYDAEPSDGAHLAQGCPAQAWSIAETLRVLVLSCKK